MMRHKKIKLTAAIICLALVIAYLIDWFVFYSGYGKIGDHSMFITAYKKHFPVWLQPLTDHGQLTSLVGFGLSAFAASVFIHAARAWIMLGVLAVLSAFCFTWSLM